MNLIVAVLFGIVGLSTAGLQAGQQWVGYYNCLQGYTKLKIIITSEQADRVNARFIFWGNGKGSFNMTGKYHPKDRSLIFKADKWLWNPSYYQMVGLKGIVSHGKYYGQVSFPGCRNFKVVLSDNQYGLCSTSESYLTNEVQWKALVLPAPWSAPSFGGGHYVDVVAMWSYAFRKPKNLKWFCNTFYAAVWRKNGNQLSLVGKNKIHPLFTQGSITFIVSERKQIIIKQGDYIGIIFNDVHKELISTTMFSPKHQRKLRMIALDEISNGASLDLNAGHDVDGGTSLLLAFTKKINAYSRRTLSTTKATITEHIPSTPRTTAPAITTTITTRKPSTTQQVPFSPDCSILFGNGMCDQQCNNVANMLDGYDCLPHVPTCQDTTLECLKKFGNNICDNECGTNACGFDGGDCLPAEIVDDFQGFSKGYISVLINSSIKADDHVALKNLLRELSRLYHTPVMQSLSKTTNMPAHTMLYFAEPGCNERTEGPRLLHCLLLRSHWDERFLMSALATTRWQHLKKAIISVGGVYVPGYVQASKGKVPHLVVTDDEDLVGSGSGSGSGSGGGNYVT